MTTMTSEATPARRRLLAGVLVVAIVVMGAALYLLRPANMRTSLRPGMYDLGEDRWRAVGTLRHEDLEGGFWAVYDALPGEPGGTRLSVLLNADELGAKKLEGRYVEAVGVREDGPSIRMAGPELRTSTLREVPAP